MFDIDINMNILLIQGLPLPGGRDSYSDIVRADHAAGPRFFFFSRALGELPAEASCSPDFEVTRKSLVLSHYA